jgi:hypothetical protein
MRRDLRESQRCATLDGQSIDRLIDDVIDAACNLALVDNGELDLAVTQVEAALARVRRQVRPRRAAFFH